MFASTDPRLAVALIVGLACLGVLVIFVVLPFIGHVSLIIEAGSLMLEGLGEYFGNTRLVYLGCAVVVLTILACCAIVVLILGALITCTAGNPAQICHVLRR